MKKKIVIPLVTAVAAIVVGSAVFRDPSKYFDSKKHPPKLLIPVTSTFKTTGKILRDPCGKSIILKGVNKLSVFDDSDRVGTRYFPEIAMSGANCVRIGWEINNETDGRMNPLTRLDSLITNAKNSKLIPIVGLWDYTNTDDGGFSHLLADYVNFWIRPDVVALISKHQAYLIVNIANEAATGDEDSPHDVTAYADSIKKAVSALRQAKINVPLMIDGMDRGKSLHCFKVKGVEILTADPQHNLIFSFHPYWAQSFTDALANKTFIASAFAAVDTVPITIVMGELAGFGAWPGDTSINICSPKGMVDYKQFAQRADSMGIGWLMWEWGPGDYWKKPGDCPQLNMTTKGKYQSIKAITDSSPNKWVRDLAIDLPFSLKHAQKTPFMMSGFQPCPKP